MIDPNQARVACTEGVRNVLAPLGHAAVAAVDSPSCQAGLDDLVAAASALADAVNRFDGTDTAALAVETAAAGYRKALQLVLDQVRRIALETLTTERPQ